MKATGIIRRIDDLGRVVIPKEIRRTMKIREGDPLEIYTDNNGTVIFKKYRVEDDPVEMLEDIRTVLETMTDSIPEEKQREFESLFSGLSAFQEKIKEAKDMYNEQF